ncbi:MAG: hypothetical protein ACE5EH_11795 [Gammaproteobacteria bacterium]
MSCRLACSLAVTVLIIISIPDISLAEVKLPTWADSGNLENELSNKGQSVANVIAMIVGMLAVIGMLVGAGYFAIQKAEQGKQWLSGGAIGLVVAGSVYGIAALFV